MLGKFDRIDSAIEQLISMDERQSRLEHRASPVKSLGGSLRRVLSEVLSLDQAVDIFFQITPYAGLPCDWLRAQHPAADIRIERRRRHPECCCRPLGRHVTVVSSHYV